MSRCSEYHAGVLPDERPGEDAQTVARCPVRSAYETHRQEVFVRFDRTLLRLDSLGVGGHLEPAHIERNGPPYCYYRRTLAQFP